THPVALLVPSAFAPTAFTLPADGITSVGAVLNATVNPRGVPTRVWFEWGTTAAYGHVTPAQTLGAAWSNITVSATLTGLTPGQTYYFRARSSNLVGPGDGPQLSFAWSAAQPAIT